MAQPNIVSLRAAFTLNPARIMLEEAQRAPRHGGFAGDRTGDDEGGSPRARFDNPHSS
jgi:hypothetical protein